MYDAYGKYRCGQCFCLFQLQKNSPCIDAGNLDSPFDPDNTIADMGALYRDINTNITQNEKPLTSISIYPNPIVDEFFVKIELEQESVIEIKLFDDFGRELGVLMKEHRSQDKIEQRFNISQLPGISSGSLIVVVSINGYPRPFKLVRW